MRSARSAQTRTLRPSQAIHLQPPCQRHRQAPNNRPGAGPAAVLVPQRAPWAVAASGRLARHSLTPVYARRPNEEYERGDDYVAFDDEEDWEQQGTTVQAPGLGPILSTALRGVSAISERLTDLALQVAPADASPGVVRVAVNAGLVLLALSFVKSLLSFFLTLGTIILGAYVAVKVFGVDVAGVAGSISGGGGGSSSDGGGRGGKARGAPRQKPGSSGSKRQDPRARQSEFKGLLGSPGSKEEEVDGLLDVWFERSKGSSSSSSRGGGSSSRGGGSSSRGGGSSSRGGGAQKGTRRR